MTKLVKFCCVIALVIAGLPLVAGSLTMGGYTFTTAGSPEWYRVNGYPDPNATAASVTWTIEMAGQTQQATMSTKIAGGGYLTFDWSGLASFYDWMPLSLEIDGEHVAGFNWMEAYGQIGFELSQTNPSFSSADIVRAAKSYWETVRLYIPAGTHTVTWRAVGSPYYEYQGTSGYPSYTMIYYGLQEGYAAIKNFSFEKYGPQYDFTAWQEKLFSYRSWVKGDLTRFATVYQKQFAATSQGYKARLLHALTTLAALGENAAVSSIAAQFGFVLDYARLQADGEMKDMPQWPNANLLSDSALPQVKTALDTALADLAAIPSTWTGSFTLTPEELLPLDEPVTIDIADIRYLQAALKAAESVILFTQAQNLETNGAKLKEATAPAKIPVIASRPTPTSALWTNVPVQEVERVNSYGVSLCDEIKVARCGSSVFVRLHKEWGFSAQANGTALNCEIHLCDGGLNDCLAIESAYNWSSFYREGWGIVENPIGDQESPITPILSEEGAYLMLELPCPSVVTQARFQGLERVQVILSQWVDYGMAMEEFLLDDDMDSYKMYLSQPDALTKVRNVAKLGDAKRLAKEAMVHIREADAKIQNRLDRALHLIEYDSVDTAILLALREKADEIIASFDAPRTFSQSWLAGIASRYGFKRVNALPEENAICLGGLFSGKFLRGDLPASTSLKTYLPCLPTLKDPTLGGLFPEMTTALWMAAFDERDIRYGNLYDYEPCSDGTVVLTGLAKGVDLGAEFVVPARIDGLEVSGLSSRFFEGCIGLKTVRFEGVNRSWMAPDAFAGAPTGLTITAMPGAGWDNEIGGTYQGVKVVQMAGTYRYLYSRNGDGARTITLLGINESKIASGELTLPASYDGYTVTRLGADFGRDSAGRPYGLTKVVLPATLLAIEDGALGQNPLAKIEVASGNPVYRVENGLLIDDANRVVLSIRNQGALVIPEGVEVIGCNAFESVSATSVKFPTTLREIEDQGFARNAFTVGEMDFSQTQLERVGAAAFNGSKMLKTVRFPQALNTCGAWAFYQCPLLSAVYYQGYIPSVSADYWSLSEDLQEECAGLLAGYPDGDLYVGRTGLLLTRLKTTSYVTPMQGWESVCEEGLWQGCPVKMKTSLVVRAQDPQSGSVSGGGSYDSGTLVALTAKPAAGYVFVGWYENGEPMTSLTTDYRAPNTKMTIPPYNAEIEARFMPTREDVLQPVLADGTPVWSELFGCPKMAGETISEKLEVASASLPTVSVSGLPSGLVFNSATLEISGVPTKPGFYTTTTTVRNATGSVYTRVDEIEVCPPHTFSDRFVVHYPEIFARVGEPLMREGDHHFLDIDFVDFDSSGSSDLYGDPTWRVSGLPLGLTLSPLSTEAGFGEPWYTPGDLYRPLMGTPTKAGVSYVTIDLSWKDGVKAQAFVRLEVEPENTLNQECPFWDALHVGSFTVSNIIAFPPDETPTSLAIAGLPPGMTLVTNAYFDGETTIRDYTIEGTPTKAGIYEITLTGTYGRTARRSVWKVEVKDRPSVMVDLVNATPEGGTISGAGLYAAGVKAALKALPKRGYVFAGWYTDAACESPADFYDPVPGQSGSGTVDMRAMTCSFYPSEYAWNYGVSGFSLYAKFMPEAEDYLEVTQEMDAYPWDLSWEFERRIVVASGSEPSCSVTGLPAGIVWRKEYQGYGETGITFERNYAVSLKPGVYQVRVDVSNAAKQTLLRTFTCIARDPGMPVITVRAEDDMGGSATGGGIYTANQVVSLKATANRGFVFAGWYVDGIPFTEGDVDYRNPVMTFKNAFDSDVEFVATFVSTEADSEVELFVEPRYDVNTTIEIPLEIASHSLPRVTVSGLPAGLQFDAKKLVISGQPTKPGSYTVSVAIANAALTVPVVKTFLIVVPNIVSEFISGLNSADDAYNFTTGVSIGENLFAEAAEGYTLSVSGLPAGLKFDAKTGLVSGAPTAAPGAYTVTFAARKGQMSEVATITINVAPPNAALVGEFNGALFAERHGEILPLGSFKLTATDKGVLSISAETTKTRYAFAIPQWESIDPSGIARATATDRSGNTLEIAIDTFRNLDENQLDGTLSTATEGAYTIQAQLNAFTRKRYYKAERNTERVSSWQLVEVDTAAEADLTFAMKTDGTSTLTGKIGAYAVNAISAVYLDSYSPRLFNAVYTQFVSIDRTTRKVLSIRLSVNRDLDEAAIMPSGEASLED